MIFCRALFLAAAGLVVSASHDAAMAAAAIRLGVAAPLTGAAAPLGAQIVRGADAAAARESTDEVETVTADTACSAAGGAAAAGAFVDAEVEAAVGFLCIEALDAALPILTAAGIPTLVVGVRANRFTDGRERSRNLVWRVGPRSDSEAAALARAIAARWGGAPFGLIDDGTIQRRGLSDAVRTLLQSENLEPAMVESFRPAEEKQFALARRIQQAGVTRLFVAGDRADVAIIARDARELGLEVEILGAESLFDEASETPLPEGVLAVAPLVLASGAPKTDAAPPEAAEGYATLSGAAVEIAVAAVREARRAERPVTDVLDGEEFATILGTLRFDAKGDSTLDHFRTFVWKAGGFVPETGG